MSDFDRAYGKVLETCATSGKQIADWQRDLAEFFLDAARNGENVVLLPARCHGFGAVLTRIKKEVQDG